MNFLLDENFPKAAEALLIARGHRCIDVRGTEFEGAADELLVEEAKNRDAVILTTDRDFYHTLRHHYPDHSGLVVIALRAPNREAIIGRLEWILANVSEDSFPGRAFQLRDRTWVAQPPIPE